MRPLRPVVFLIPGVGPSLSAFAAKLPRPVADGWPRLDGDVVNLTALGLGYAATYLPDVVELETGGWVERMSAAVFISGTSAIFAQITKPQTPIGV